MNIVATRGNLRLCDSGNGMGYLEGRAQDQRPLDSFLKWGYWEPVQDEPVVAAGPLPGEGPLVRKYEAILERNAKRCKRNYLRSSRVVTAAGEEQNRNPLLGEVLDEGALSESAKSTKAQQQKIAEEAARQAALEMGISFAVVSPYVKDLVLAQAGRQAERIVAGVRELVASLILRSLEEGWSVPQTADKIYQGLGEAKKWQATMLARTDLIAMGNGGSFAVASALGDAAPKYKQWKNADDEKVRPTHVEAEDQVVPLASPFTVGGASLMFPGDPSGPDNEVINCRCTLVYTDNPDVMISAGFDESKHPHVPAGSSKGGQWAETSDPHALDDNPPQEEIKRSWDDLYGRSLNWESDEYVNAPKPPWAGDRFGPGQVYHDAQFTADQHQAMEHYQGSGYASVNHLLRDPADFHARVAESRKNSASQVWDMLTAYNGETPEQIEASVMAQVNDLDSSLRPNPTPVTAYRINHLAWDDPPTMEAVKDVYGEIGPDIVGKTVVDPAFQSTTLDKAWADRRADSSGGTRAILHRIHVPAGVPAIYMPSAHPSMSFDEEEELTLGRDTPMRAVGYEERPDGTKVIDWEVVGW